MIRILYMAFLILLGPSVFGAEAATGKEGARPADRPADRPSGPPDKGAPTAVTIEFSARPITGAERTPQGELKALIESTATLKTARPIRYRSVTLPAGEYSVRITSDEDRGGRNVFFLIGRPEGESQAPEPVQPPQAPPAGGKAREKGPAKRSDEKTNPTKDREGGGGPSEKAPDAKRPKTAPDFIKAIFHVAPAAQASEKVEFSVRQSRRGDRFVLMVRAGSSQGKSTLRFADIK